eukprot:CAMPEP_0198541132 /NCGR_PEP_ID=MMETSP1462-20131121/53584_1 /TAXON_ID=1333877 /ORGANISM="Brandtodinium nutriculum, Strain RCC3387" /LENGTH=51 /DNA_ID=CAMNT_0044271283 /DNA_START=59 /DNA_END=211 /DNA_ORIENTATION=+
MTQLWSVLAPFLPARQTLARLTALLEPPASAPSDARAPLEPVSTRMVESGQ